MAKPLQVIQGHSIDTLKGYTSLEHIRIQRWLAMQGLCSRRQAEEWIKQGRLYIDGHRVDLGACIPTDLVPGRITLDGNPIGGSPPAPLYIMFHKPDKTLVSRASQGGKPTIYESAALKPYGYQLQAVGRLDYRSEGLLLLTNDGNLNYQLTHPRFHIEKVYWVIASAPLSAQSMASTTGVRLADGIVHARIRPLTKKELLGAYPLIFGSKRAQIHHPSPHTLHAYEVTVQEGRKHLVRRLFETLQSSVIQLVRIKLGTLTLPSKLKSGQVYILNSHEISQLKKHSNGLAKN